MGAAARPAAAVDVVPRARGGAEAPYAEAETQDAAGPARRRDCLLHNFQVQAEKNKAITS